MFSKTAEAQGSMAKNIVVKVIIGNYKYVEIPIEEAEKLLQTLLKDFPDKEKDIKEVARIIKNFDVFYEIARKKFKNYILIPHDTSDMLRGTVLFDKVKLISNEEGRKIGLFFDRSISIDDVVRVLRNLGYNVNVAKSEI